MRTRAVLRGLRPIGAVLLALVAGSSAPLPDAAAFNGTWQLTEGSLETEGEAWLSEFRVWALDDRRLQVEFSGDYQQKTPSGPVSLIAGAGGVGVRDGGKVMLRDEQGGDCAFTLRLREGRLVAHASPHMCQGMRIIADGTYRRAGTTRPRFDFAELPEE